MKRISKTEIKEMRSQSKKNRIMFAFTLPTVILYTIFFLVTMLIGVYYSFTDWNGISKDANVTHIMIKPGILHNFNFARYFTNGTIIT